MIRHADWKECFARVRQHRSLLKQDHGIFLRKEIHSQEFVSGRGRISDRILGKHQRSRIFEGLLRLATQLPNVRIVNICLERRGRANVQMDAWDRLVNRIERMMLGFEQKELPLRRNLVAQLEDSVPEETRQKIADRLNAYHPAALIFADEGREPEITKAIRKMSVYNPIPSTVGDWGGGVRAKNIPIQRIIEDPIFKKSHQSYFIQLADAIAFSLLKREVTPTPNVKKYDIHKMFDRCLAGVCYRPASSYDPLGIVRK